MIRLAVWPTFFFSLLIISSGNLTAQSDSIFISNVFMLSQTDTADLKVSVILVGGRLELVTTDNITGTPGSRVYDGQGGFLMGRIEIGQPANFVVLRESPRENFDIILNSREYLDFAIENGRIISNRLDQVHLDPEQANRRRFTWTAYSPPLMAVPFNYYSSRKWNKFNTKYVSGLFNGIIALDRMHWLSQDTNSEGQVGELEESSLGEIRAIRFGIIGTLNFERPWIYTIFITNNSFDRDYSDDDNGLTLYDFRLDIPLPSGITMSVGKQKEPISMSRLTTLIFLPMQERQAAEDAFLPARNIGIVFNNMYLNSRATWAVGVFKNWIERDTTFKETPTQITGRITGIPYLTDDESNIVHVGLGVRYSDAKLPLVGKTESEFYLSPVFVETPEIQADYLLTYDLELYLRKGPLLVGGEYIGNRVKAPTVNDPSFHGYNLMGNWAVTGEMRPYRKRSGIFDPMPVSKPVGQGGGGALEVSFRHSLIDLDGGLVNGGTMKTTSVGVTWWPSPRVQFGCNYRFIKLDRLDMLGKSSGMNFRLMMILD